MAEYTRGQDKRYREDSANNNLKQSPKISPVNGFEGMNFEQVRAPYCGERNRGNRLENEKVAENTGRQ